MKVEVNVDKSLEEIFVEIHTPSENDELKNILKKLSYKELTLKGVIEDKTYLLNSDDLYVIYAENKKVFAATKDKVFRLGYRLYELEEILDSKKFIRISNSAIINIYKVDNFEASFNGLITINLKNGAKEYISRRYLKKVKKTLSLWGDKMVKVIIKRGVIGAVISLVAILSLLFGILIINGYQEITFNIGMFIRYLGTIMISGFIISATTIIFNLKRVPLLLSIVLHFILMFIALKFSIIYLEVLENQYLIQAVLISLYIIIASITFLSIVFENKKDVELINKSLRNL